MAKEYDIQELLGSAPVDKQEYDINELLLNATPAKQSMQWKDVPLTAMRNLPQSAYNLASGVGHAITHPLETAGNLLDIGAGTLRNITPDAIAKLIDKAEFNPEAAKRATNAADQLAAMYKQRYGSSEGFKEALAKDPAGVMADAATLISPISGGLNKAVTLPAKAGGKLAASTLGLSTGTGAESVARAFQSGLQGDKSFWQNLTGQVPMQDVLDTAKQNLQNMKIQKNDAYRSGMVDIKNDKAVLDFEKIDQALKDAEKMATFKGQVKNKKGHEIYQELRDEVDAWKKLNPGEYHTPEGLDALKQKLGGIVDSIPYEEKTAKMIGDQVYKKTKSTIEEQAPTYANVMKDYSEASDQVREIERALSLKDKASADTAMRKLQSLTRNNVYTNYGNRVKLAQELEQQGGQPFMNALAGQAMSSITPRGLAGQGGVMGTLGTGLYLQNPAAALVLPFQSPAAVGAGAYGAGRLAAGVQNVANKIPLTAPQGTALSNFLPQLQNNPYRIDLTGMANQE